MPAHNKAKPPRIHAGGSVVLEGEGRRMIIDPSDLTAGIDDLEVEEGALVESCVMLVKVSNADGTSSLHHCESSGMSHWEAVGMLYDTLQGMTAVGAWED